MWGDTHDITAVEINPQIAKIYSDFFPKDTMVIGDAHQYLLEHFKEFEFIWSSPPCSTHSRMNMINGLFSYKDNTKQIAHGGGIPPRYASMDLLQEIIFLKHWFGGIFCVENVISYYEPLFKPQMVGKHYFWANFFIKPFDIKSREHHGGICKWQEKKGFDLSQYKNIDKRAVLRNCVEPELGLHILNESKRDIQPELFAT